MRKLVAAMDSTQLKLIVLVPANTEKQHKPAEYAGVLCHLFYQQRLYHLFTPTKSGHLQVKDPARALQTIRFNVIQLCQPEAISLATRGTY